ncbi:O-succinylbenzoic acid--CoA ligase [Bacteroidetes bacterium SCGC AAA795-G10]|nr:O-succinylbenzoic acid--CoA ligase [Bacteroidetes bacterium SCGC AAA795-G10]
MEAPKFSKIHNRFRLNGYFYDRNTLKEVAYNFIKEGDLYETFMGDFILDWLDNSDSIYLSTSISKENKILVKKQSLVSSAISTGDFLKVSVGDKALHCLPTNYIAGKMMLIRALILGLEIDLVSPSKKPFYKNEKFYDFAAMTPIQAFHSIPELGRIKKLIIGGAYLSNALQQALIKAKINAYETYGMMETLSHIAVRRMTDPISEFKCLPGIFVGQDNRKCLIIDAPRLDIKNLITNDQVELYSPSKFRLIGSIDHIIKLDGYNIHPEQVERKLSEKISFHFFIDKIAFKSKKEKLTIVIEDNSKINYKKIKDQIKSCTKLKQNEIPKYITLHKKFIQTYSGKIKRKETMNQNPFKVLDL